MRRARGYRLYDRLGRRYLDLWQGGGSTILGHRSAGTVREMKDALSRGLFSRLPSDHQRRLERTILRMFPRYAQVRIYPCLCEALDAVSAHLGRRVAPEDVRDPAMGGPAPKEDAAAYWRPFLPAEDSAAMSAVLIPILPVGWEAGAVPVCFRSSRAPDPPWAVSPAACAGALRALADLPAALPHDGRLSASLEGACSWRLTGPYLAYTSDPRDYPAVFSRFLEAGVLLSPDSRAPSILPRELSDGERGLLLQLFLADKEK